MSNLLGWFRRRWLGETEANLPDVENQVHEQPATFPNQHANDYHEYGNQHRNGYHNGRNGGQYDEDPNQYRTDHGHGSRNDIYSNFRNDFHNRNESLNDLPNERHRERRDNYRNRHHDEYHNHPRNHYGNDDRDGRRDDRYDENRHQYRNTYRINSGNNPRNNFDNDRRNGRLDSYRERNENRNAHPRNHRDDYPHPHSESEESDSSEDDFITCRDINSVPSDVGTAGTSPSLESLHSFQRLSSGPNSIAGSSRNSSVPSTAPSRVFDSESELSRQATPPTSNDGNDDDPRGRTYDVISDDDSDITYVWRRSFNDTLIPEYGSSGPSRSSDSPVSSQPSGSSYPPGFNLTPDFRYAAGPSDASTNTTDDESVHTVVETGPAHNSNISLEQPPIGPEVPASERSSRHSACHTPRIQRAREDVPRRGSHRRNRSPEPPKKSISRKTSLYVLGEGYAAQLLRKAAQAGNAAEVRSILANAPKHYLQSPAFTKGAVLACVAKPKYGTYKSLGALVNSMDESRLNNIRDRGKTPLFLLISEPSRESFGKYHSKSLRVLLEAGAKADEMNGAENQTALHLAVAKRLPGAVKILVDYRASPDIPDGNGKTARELADHNVKALTGHESFQEAQDWTKIQEVFDGVGHAH
ncbi:ankyrin repeat-containing protein [Colletotrichum plurivorum]|uniref:Ankyrin repeat-containing protein n=1 Tax=Colletotrichum plurivorum TaxID=2175906 RepID=A0A8H6N5F8_9PEZI|nr:ankyrin repeat-containing protein [Colletotrichum plurivorum]